MRLKQATVARAKLEADERARVSVCVCVWYALGCVAYIIHTFNGRTYAGNPT